MTAGQANSSPHFQCEIASSAYPIVRVCALLAPFMSGLLQYHAHLLVCIAFFDISEIEVTFTNISYGINLIIIYFVYNLKIPSFAIDGFHIN